MAQTNSQIRPKTTGPLWVWLVLAALVTGGVGGCSWLGFGEEELPPGEEAIPDDPFKAGMLKAVGHLAPAGSVTQYLATLADSMGWENEVKEDFLLRMAADEGTFNEKVEPMLLGLFFKHGFSILPTTGEAHEFSRDTIVRQAVSDTRFLVRNRETFRLIFLGPVNNVTIIYPKDGREPQVFTLDPNGKVALRQSLLDQYLD